MCATVCMGRPKDNLWELVLFLPCGASGMKLPSVGLAGSASSPKPSCNPADFFLVNQNPFCFYIFPNFTEE